MTLRKIVCWLFGCAWNALRVCSALLLSIYLVTVIHGIWVAQPWLPRKSRPFSPTVCGKISGNVYEFSRLYFPFWPEYEGKSSFDPEFVNNIKGCDANLVSVFLSMTWPALKPADDSLIFRQGLEHEGLLVAVKPITAREGDLRFWLDYNLRKSPPGILELAEHDTATDLYRVEVKDTVFEHHPKRLYWEGELRAPAAVGYCSWRPKIPNYYSCKMTFVVFDNVLVEVIMRPDKLREWVSIRREVESFLVNSIK